MSTKELVEKINKMGWFAHYYPRLKMVSLDGGRRVGEKEARTIMLQRIGGETA